MDKLHGLFDHEDQIYRQSLAHVQADPQQLVLLTCIEECLDLMLKAASVPVASEDDKALSALAARVFNSAAASVRQALTGHYQVAWSIVRDLVEAGILCSYFRYYPAKIARWRVVTTKERLKEFKLVKLREEIGDVDQNEAEVRREQFELFSEHASHLTYQSLRLLSTADGSTRVGPVFEPNRLGNCLFDIARQVNLSALPLLACLLGSKESGRMVGMAVSEEQLARVRHLGIQAGVAVSPPESAK